MPRARPTHCARCPAKIASWTHNSRAIRCPSCQDKRTDARVRLRDARNAAENAASPEARARNAEKVPRLEAEYEAT